MENIEKKLLNNNEINFLMEISKVLSDIKEPSKIVDYLSFIFKTYFPVENMVFMVWDETSEKLRDFSKEWVSFDDDIYNNRILEVFRKLKSSKKLKFFFNQEFVDAKVKVKDYSRICSSISDKSNVIFLPLSARQEVFGLVEIHLGSLNETVVFNSHFFDILYVALMQISNVVMNYILKEQMEISVQFYEAMKNIAKIIESQYELAYIIPLIGEMIDRFISAHLIYIFIKNKDNEFELLWPNACKDKEIMALLKNINSKTDYIISDNKKIGVFPLINENTVLGAIVAYSNIDKLIQKEIEYLSQLSKQSSATIQRANVYAEVLKHATLDALTGLNNRRQFEMRLNQEIATTRRKGYPLCCMMIDVDYFKSVNDTYGHAAGDCVLKAVANVISREIREYDIASRYGGEEFFVLLPQTTIEEANFVAQRLRKSIEESKMDISEAKIPDKEYIKITASIGVCDFQSGDSAESFYQNADKALYEAKHRGRNKVVVYKRDGDCK